MLVRFPNKTFYLEQKQIEQIPLLKELDLLNKSDFPEKNQIELMIGEEFFERIIKNDFSGIELTTEIEQLSSYFGVSVPERLHLIKEIKRNFPNPDLNFSNYSNWKLKCYIASHNSFTEYANLMDVLVWNYNSNIIQSPKFKEFITVKQLTTTLVFQRTIRIYTFIKQLCENEEIRLLPRFEHDDVYCTIQTNNKTHIHIDGSGEYYISGIFQNKEIQKDSPLKYFFNFSEFMSHIFNLHYE